MADEPQTPEESTTPPDYDSMTAEELEALLDTEEGSVILSDSEPEQPASETDAPEAPDVPADESPADPVEEAPAEPEAPEPEFDEQASRVEELELQLLQRERQDERAVFQRDREAGQVGSLKQELESLKALVAKQQEGYEGEEDGNAAPPPAPAFRDSRVDDLLDANKRERISSAWQEFVGRVGAEVELDLRAAANDTEVTAAAIEAEREVRMKAMMPRIQEEISVYKAETLNIKATEKVARMAMDSAHIGWKINRVRDLRSAAQKKQATQVSSSKREKLAASISGSGSSAPAAAPKRAEDMTAEEADAALIAEHGDGRRQRRL